MANHRTRHDTGFTLVELLVSMTITLLILAGTVVAMTNAMRASETAKSMTGMNSNLRVGMDMMARDFIQTGQGMPTGRVVSIPNGDGAVPILRPGPPGTVYTFDPASPVLSSVTSGPGLGPMVNGQQTDMVTVIASDSSFESQTLTALGASSMTVNAAVNITDGGPDDIHQGDLIMLLNGTFSALMYVTGVNGQTVRFENGDPMRLNQYDAGLDMLGTLDQFRDNVTNLATVTATRVRMISYYLDATTDATNPRLVRRLNGDPGRAVAFAIDNLTFSFDIADGATNPANVRMDANDLGGGGACSPSPCFPNQVRKINVFLGGRSRHRFAASGDFLRNSLATQVSLRNLAFVDRYR